ncbi:unnamed protein product [Schistosoma margrebowiei]|uniref:DUF7041 domain-containing protein n=1 Tax=Schistosoma margrebowiei TaxID=48269 RepID=A0A183N285_9TREM|nr:unnamed protein product [Schistosoma margrebowiei]
MTDSDKSGINIIDSDIQAIHFRPVAFIPHDPEVWFAALESRFETRRITNQKQKYAFDLESLPGDDIVAIREVVLNPNVPNVYDRLKEAILRHFLPFREERLRTLLARHSLGDAKPSHHLMRLQLLAGPTAADSEIVRELWHKSLPAHIQPKVTALPEDVPLHQVALTTDKILARTNNKDNYVVAATAHLKVDLDAKHSSEVSKPKTCVDTPTPTSMSRFRSESVFLFLTRNSTLYTTLEENRYPEKFINKNITNKREHRECLTVNKKPLYIRLQFRGDEPSEMLRLKLSRPIQRAFNAGKLQLPFSTRQMITLRLKDKLPRPATSFFIILTAPVEQVILADSLVSCIIGLVSISQCG